MFMDQEHSKFVSRCWPPGNNLIEPLKGNKNEPVLLINECVTATVSLLYSILISTFFVLRGKISILNSEKNLNPSLLILYLKVSHP